MTVRHFMRVLETELADWIAIGWRECFSHPQPSLACRVVCVEWAGEGEPKEPEKKEP